MDSSSFAEAREKVLSNLRFTDGNTLSAKPYLELTDLYPEEENTDFQMIQTRNAIRNASVLDLTQVVNRELKIEAIKSCGNRVTEIFTGDLLHITVLDVDNVTLTTEVAGKLESFEFPSSLERLTVANSLLNLRTNKNIIQYLTTCRTIYKATEKASRLKEFTIVNWVVIHSMFPFEDETKPVPTSMVGCFCTLEFLMELNQYAMKRMATVVETLEKAPQILQRLPNIVGMDSFIRKDVEDTKEYLILYLKFRQLMQTLVDFVTRFTKIFSGEAWFSARKKTFLAQWSMDFSELKNSYNKKTFE